MNAGVALRALVGRSAVVVKPVTDLLQFLDARDRADDLPVLERRAEKWAQRLIAIYGDDAAAHLIKEYRLYCLSTPGVTAEQAVDRRKHLEFYCLPPEASGLDGVRTAFLLIHGQWQDVGFINGMERRLRDWQRRRQP